MTDHRSDLKDRTSHDEHVQAQDENNVKDPFSDLSDLMSAFDDDLFQPETAEQKAEASKWPRTSWDGNTPKQQVSPPATDSADEQDIEIDEIEETLDAQMERELLADQPLPEDMKSAASEITGEWERSGEDDLRNSDVTADQEPSRERPNMATAAALPIAREVFFNSKDSADDAPEIAKEDDVSAKITPSKAAITPAPEDDFEAMLLASISDPNPVISPTPAPVVAEAEPSFVASQSQDEPELIALDEIELSDEEVAFDAFELPDVAEAIEEDIESALDESFSSLELEGFDFDEPAANADDALVENKALVENVMSSDEDNFTNGFANFKDDQAVTFEEPEALETPEELAEHSLASAASHITTSSMGSDNSDGENNEPDLSAIEVPETGHVDVTGDLGIPNFDYQSPGDKNAQASNKSDGFDDFDGFEDFDLPSENTQNQDQISAMPSATAGSEKAVSNADAEFEALFDEQFRDEFTQNGLPVPDSIAAGQAGTANYAQDGNDPFAFQDSNDTDDGSVAPAFASTGIKKKRGLIVASAVAIVAILGAGLVLGSSLFMSTSQNDGNPEIVRADNEPIKVTPEDPGGLQVPNQDRAVFEAVEGTDLTQPEQDVLVDAREIPLIDQIKDEDRILQGDNSGEQPVDEAAVLAPRRVQTITVRPDGTLVEPLEQPSFVAPSSDNVAVPAPRPESSEPREAVTDIANNIVDQVPVREVEVQQIRPATPQTSVAQVPNNAIAVPSRPSDQPVTIVNDATVSATNNAAPQQVAAISQVPQGSFVMQIASQPSRDAAQSSYNSLSSRFGSIIGGRQFVIREAEIADRGTFYRVQIVAGSRDEANQLCNSFKSAGGNCFVTR